MFSSSTMDAQMLKDLKEASKKHLKGLWDSRHGSWTLEAGSLVVILLRAYYSALNFFGILIRFVVGVTALFYIRSLYCNNNLDGLFEFVELAFSPQFLRWYFMTYHMAHKCPQHGPPKRRPKGKGHSFCWKNTCSLLTTCFFISDSRIPTRTLKVKITLSIGSKGSDRFRAGL